MIKLLKSLSMNSEPLKIKVVAADDHPFVLDGLKALLQKQPHIDFVGVAANGRRLLALVLQRQPDIVIMDASMPEMDGIEATRKILAVYPLTGIIVLSAFDDSHLLMEILDAGARGYLL